MVHKVVHLAQVSSKTPVKVDRVIMSSHLDMLMRLLVCCPSLIGYKQGFKKLHELFGLSVQTIRRRGGGYNIHTTCFAFAVVMSQSHFQSKYNNNSQTCDSMHGTIHEEWMTVNPDVELKTHSSS